MLVQKECLFCKKVFSADSREIKRGNAKYCSISCGYSYRNINQPIKKCTCIHCGIIFESKSTKAKYCSDKCKLKHYRQLMHTEQNGTRKLHPILLTFPCENCKWQEGPRDVHHILPVSEGGKNELLNLITLCPNCHRLAHRNLLSKDKLILLVNLRTISSSDNQMSGAQAGN